MKISEITKENVVEFARLPGDEDATLKAIMAAAAAYIQSYTGLTYIQMDKYEDLTMVYLVLCSEMYDARSLTVDNTRINPFVKTILNMHSVNLL